MSPSPLYWLCELQADVRLDNILGDARAHGLPDFSIRSSRVLAEHPNLQPHVLVVPPGCCGRHRGAAGDCSTGAIGWRSLWQGQQKSRGDEVGRQYQRPGR